MQQDNRLFIMVIMFLILGCSVGHAGSNEPPKSETTTNVILIRHAGRDNFFNISGFIGGQRIRQPAIAASPAGWNRGRPIPVWGYAYICHPGSRAGYRC